mmetsp:Transcript_61858/g.151238  ORF Transcript_61858/g.151238 Transcript_61858/m.151238 type:complete len:156 (+) Transcript_61858:207-674(+)|eukprot:CAMPEP_0113501040 /NCGR_PEP_ID=MMETSP0014_2-20120614/32707_1 /TAXON_ID=2857 /ORGANISM="Nitzschia sp." /LENGTH=155 /DNA_ID=CAMNT_0000395531 /DNA_START=174 /DNA_END=641 /DNA_ORIENTATION=+ /assembly_acc=CAM_ASM_000159
MFRIAAAAAGGGIRGFSTTAATRTAATANNKKVLLLGLGGGANPPPVFKGGLTKEKLMSMLHEQNKELERRGVDPTMLLLDSEAPHDDIAKTVTDALSQTTYDVVSIGAGVRTTPEQFLLFERLVNLVHEHAPDARFAFDTGPGDKVESIFRQIE